MLQNQNDVPENQDQSLSPLSTRPPMNGNHDSSGSYIDGQTEIINDILDDVFQDIDRHLEETAPEPLAMVEEHNVFTDGTDDLTVDVWVASLRQRYDRAEAQSILASCGTKIVFSPGVGVSEVSEVWSKSLGGR